MDEAGLHKGEDRLRILPEARNENGLLRTNSGALEKLRSVLLLDDEAQN